MKNHLFIGLGGQGGKSIAELRKVFEQRSEDADSLRDQGQHWDFLYIDSSRDVINRRENWTHFGKNLQLENNSFLYLRDQGQELNARTLALQPDVAPWIGDVEQLEGFLGGAQGIQGANQRRRFGRLLFASNADRIRTAICDQKVAPLTENGNECAFHIFASLAGGTGSGSIIDLVTLLRTQYPSAGVVGGFPIFLYLYVTSDDFEEAKVGYFHQNQYAAIRDLNALACSRYKPTMLGSYHGGTEFSQDEPITQILLSTSLNDRNQRLSLSKQHQIVAEAAFERVYAYCNGDWDEDVQKTLTGEDRLPSYPGEPLGKLLRSFRFGSTGMRRWEVPTEEIHELLANDLYVSAFREMAYQNWNDDHGFLKSRVPPTRSGASDLAQSLASLLESVLLEKQDFPSLLDALSTDLSTTHAGLKREGFRDKDLDDYEVALNDRFHSHLNGVGLEETFASFRENREARLDKLSAQIGDAIQSAWGRVQSPIGLAYVPDALLELQEKLRNRLAEAGENQEGGDADSRLRARMEARKREWQKMTFLSRAIKQNAMAEAHRKDLLNLFAARLRRQVADEDVETLGGIITELGSLDSSFRDSVIKVEDWLRKKENRRETIENALSDLHRDNVSNKSELSRTDFDQCLQLFRTERTDILNTCEQLKRSVILPALSGDSLNTLRNIKEERESVFWEKADELVYDRARQIHNGIVEKHRIKPILTSELLDTLKERYDQNPDSFKKELEEFIDSATASIRIDNSQFQPSVLRGDDGMPSMPRKALVLGLPRGHNFSQTLESLIDSQAEAGNNTAKGIYFHEDPAQIRLLFVASWMAARFATVIKDLEQRYNRSLDKNQGGDTAYFTNIDESGEKNQRPPLLLPSPEESRSVMRAGLWLGQRIPIDSDGTYLIEESDNQVSLMQNTDIGLVSRRIGSSIDDAKRSADILKISQVSDAVTQAIVGKDSDFVEEIKSSVRQEDKRMKDEFGAGSQEFDDWTSDRDKIYDLLAR
ncbi:MAG: tubulin-like doman-containing protein [Verrucomicrobiales bacterium]|nr:tubulin-like doman-containing protein [Verrucomicrobiales bacterium]MDF2378178.1 tubulin-like doman-containing protein [Verrucomicrobiales bacterium]